MAVVLTQCNCPQPLGPIDFCGEPAVIENETCLITPIPLSAGNLQITLPDPLPVNNLTVELVCCNLVVVCGFITKTITFIPVGGTLVTREINIPIQAQVRLTEDPSVLLTPENLTVLTARVCGGCYRLLCPTSTTEGTVFHKLREKDILEFTFRYTPVAG